MNTICTSGSLSSTHLGPFSCDGFYRGAGPDRVNLFLPSLLLTCPLVHLPPQEKGQTLTEMLDLPLPFKHVPDVPSSYRTSFGS